MQRSEKIPMAPSEGCTHLLCLQGGSSGYRKGVCTALQGLVCRGKIIQDLPVSNREDYSSQYEFVRKYSENFTSMKISHSTVTLK